MPDRPIHSAAKRGYTLRKSSADPSHVAFSLFAPSLSLLVMPATLTPTTTAVSLAGVWRLLEVNSLPMQETPPYGQINRKEIYTADGKLLVVRPDAPFAQAKLLGTYEVNDGVRIYTAPDGEQTATPIQWI